MSRQDTIADEVHRHIWRPQDHCTIYGMAYCTCGWSEQIPFGTTDRLHHAHHVAEVVDTRLREHDNLTRTVDPAVVAPVRDVCNGCGGPVLGDGWECEEYSVCAQCTFGTEKETVR